MVSVSTPLLREITCFSGVRLAAEPNLLTNEMLESVLPVRTGVTFSATQLERSLVSISSIVVRARCVASTFANTRWLWRRVTSWKAKRPRATTVPASSTTSSSTSVMPDSSERTRRARARASISRTPWGRSS